MVLVLEAWAGVEDALLEAEADLDLEPMGQAAMDKEEAAEGAEVLDNVKTKKKKESLRSS